MRTNTIQNFAMRFATIAIVLLTVGVGSMLGAIFTGDFTDGVPTGWSATGSKKTGYYQLGTTNDCIQTPTFSVAASGTITVIINAYVTGSSKSSSCSLIGYNASNEAVETKSVTCSSSSMTSSYPATTWTLTNSSNNIKYVKFVYTKATSSNMRVSAFKVTFPTTITLNANGGAANQSAKYNHEGTTYVAFTAVTRDGYNCTGYWTASSGGTKILNANGSLAAASITVSAIPYTDSNTKWVYAGDALTLYAQWTASCTSQTVTVSDGDTGSDAYEGEYNYGTSPISLSLSKSGSGTVTWISDATDVATVSGNSSGATVTIVGAGTATITASVAADATHCAGSGEYALTVNSVAPTLSHNTSGKELTVSSFTSTGATFYGGVVTSKGGDASLSSYGFIVGTSADVKYKDRVTQAGTNEDYPINTAFGSQSVTGLTPNTTYYVRAIANNPGGHIGYSTAVSFTTLQSYAISYNNNGGSGSMDGTTKDHGVNFTLPANAGSMTKTGHHITGWLLGSSSGTHYDVSGIYEGNAAATFYVEWTANTYQVAFNANGGTGSMSNEDFTYGASAKALTTCSFTPPTHKYFIGWNTDKDATSALYTDGQSVSNLTTTHEGTVTLYAIWEDHTYTNYRTSCCTDPGLAYGTGSVNKTFGDGTFTNTLTNSHSVAVTYSSSDETVATVNSSGLVTIKKVGSTTITASSIAQTVEAVSYCADEASYTLTVNKADISPTLSYDPAAVTVGNTLTSFTLSGNTGSGSVSYISSDDDIATVNSSGVVTGVAAGTVTITATIAATTNYNGNTATSNTITVNAAACTGTYSLHTGNKDQGGWITNQCFSDVDWGEDDDAIYVGAFPLTNECYVGYAGSGSYYGTNWAVGGIKTYDIPNGRTLGWNSSNYYESYPGGALGTFHIYTESRDENYYLRFKPSSYVLRTGSDGTSWTSRDMTVSASNSHYYETAELDLTSTLISEHAYVDLKTSGGAGHVWCNFSNDRTASGNVKVKSSVGDADGNFRGTDLQASDAGTHGKFRIDITKDVDNWKLAFVPMYRISYAAGTGATGSMDPSSYVEISTTIAAASESFTDPTGKQFSAWSDGVNTYAVGDNVTMNSNVTLTAQWTDIDYTVTVNQSPSAGATTTGQTTEAHYGGTINLTTTVPDGYQFVNWTTSDGFVISNNTSATTASFTMPAKNVTVTANFIRKDTYKTAMHEAVDAWEDYAEGVAKTGNGYTIPNPGDIAVGDREGTGCEGKHYHFAGWVTNANKEAGTISGNIIPASGTTDATGTTYWAVWEKEKAGSGTGYTQTTTVSAGDVVVIAEIDDAASEKTGRELSGFSSTSTVYGLYSDFATTPAGTIEWTVEEGYNSTGVAFKNSSDEYLYLASAANSLSTSDSKSAQSSWSVTTDSERAKIVNNNWNTRIICWNGGSPRFACYASKDHGDEVSGSPGKYYYYPIFYKKNTISYEDPKVECICSENPVAGTAAVDAEGTFSASSIAVKATGASTGHADCSYTDYGFVWSSSVTTPTLVEGTGAASTNCTKVPVGNDGEVTSFTGSLEGSFTANNPIYFRSYVKNEKSDGTYQYSSVVTVTPRSVTFNLNGHGSSAPAAQFVNNGSKATDPSYSESVTGYIFGGWYKEAGCSNAWNFASDVASGESKTLYAKWTPISYSVRFNDNDENYLGDATGSMSNESFTYDQSKALTANGFSLAGYDFAGWALTPTGDVAHLDEAEVENLSSTNGATVDLYAIWTAKSYDVTLAATNETSSVGSQTVTATYNAAMPTDKKGGGAVAAPSRTGYTFTGWEYSSTTYYDYNAGTSTLSSAHVWDQPNSTTTLTPKWSINSYLLTWDLAGGTVATAGTGASAGATGTPSSSVEYNSAITAPTVTKSGYNFAGWDVDVAATMPAAATTYTATWTTKTLNSISLAEDAVTIYDQQYVLIDVIYDPADILTKGYTLVSSPTKVVTTSSTNAQLKLSATKTGVVISETVSETVSIQAKANTEKTASVTVTINPLPRVHFKDLIHGETFSDAVATINGSNALDPNKTTPTHVDFTGSTANGCEETHLHLVGWIRNDWPALVAYLNGEGDAPTVSELENAGTGYWFEPNASINVQTYDGKIFYAVWAVEE